MNACAINAFGELGICTISQQETFSIREKTVKEVWDGALLKLRAQKRTRSTKCTNCRIQSLCGMCPANGELENGDRETPVSFLCQAAHLRAAVIGSLVTPHGECEFCSGGFEHEALMESAHRIKTKQIDVEAWVAPTRLLPVLNSIPATGGGCGSCGSH